MKTITLQTVEQQFNQMFSKPKGKSDPRDGALDGFQDLFGRTHKGKAKHGDRSGRKAPEMKKPL